MLTFELKNINGTILFDGAFPKTDYNTKEQKTDPNGQLLWTVNCLVREPESRRTETLAVQIAAPKNPEEVLQPFTPIAFEGLSLLTGEMNGRPFVSLRADKIGAIK